MGTMRSEDALVPFLGALAQTQAQLYFGAMAHAVSSAGRNRFADAPPTAHVRRLAIGVLGLILLVSCLAGTAASVELKLMGTLRALADHSDVHARGFLIALPMHFAASVLFDGCCSIVLVSCASRRGDADRSGASTLAGGRPASSKAPARPTSSVASRRFSAPSSAPD